MAIYSLHHGNVGKSTQREPGTAGAHVRYITRESAARVVMAEHMPDSRAAAQGWMDRQEAADRKNARVIDKVMVALPVELDAEQRVQLVRDFVHDVTGGRTPWMAAIHDRDEDAHNPHAHIIIRDRDIETGKRAIGTSEKGSTDRLREMWEKAANRALERAGFDARIDRRTLEAQGNDKEPGIHVGPNVAAMEEKGRRPVSVAMEINGRVVNWPEIDQGRTRADRQREIEAANDLEGETEDDRGKKTGAPPTDPAPSQAAPDAVVEAREKWAQQLRDLVASEAAEKLAREQEAIAAKAERNRLAAAIERGWEKLTGLAHRLEAAWQRILHGHKPPQPNASSLHLDPEPQQQRAAYTDHEHPAKRGLRPGPQNIKSEASTPCSSQPQTRLQPSSATAEGHEERRKRRFAELLADELAKRPAPTTDTPTYSM